VHVIDPPVIKGNKEVTSLGSGFVVGKENVNGSPVSDIVTNQHVVGDNRQVTIQVNGESCTAKVAKVDYKNDLALLQVRADSCAAPLIPLQLAQPGTLGRGDLVTSLGFAGTSTTMRENWGPVTSQSSNVYKAATELKHGQSGGPSFDRSGQVVGVNDYVYGRGRGGVITRVDGSGFIPVEKVWNLLGYRT
jgi:serine protease Do